MPEYDYPELNHGDDSDYFTFFYHWNTKYIIRVLFKYDGFIKLFVVKENDEIFDEIKIQTSIGTPPFLVNPNGWYFAYLETKPEDPMKKIEEGAFYLELRIYELIVDELGGNLILNKIKTIQDFNKTYNLGGQYDFVYSNFLLSDDLDIYYKSETYDYNTYKYTKKVFFNDIDFTD